MADDIKIRVGVQNNVKAGMGSIIRDIEEQGKGAGSRFGRGFKSAMTGDIAGAMNAVFGGFVAGAAVAGWNAGKAIDQAFKISDNVAAWWTKGLDAAGAAWDKFYKTLRAQRQTLETLFASGMKLDENIFGTREKSKLARMTPSEKVNYLGEGLGMAENGVANANADLAKAAAEASKPSKDNAEAEARTTRLKEAMAERDRIVMLYEEMKADYQDALDARSAAWAKAQKAEYDATVQAENDKREAIKRTFEIEEEWRRQNADAARAALMADIAARQKAADANAGNIGNLQADAQAAQDMTDPQKRRAAENAEREERRRVLRLAQAEERRARGIKSAADDRLIAAKDARKALDDAQLKQANDIAAIRAMEEQLFVMKGGQ